MKEPWMMFTQDQGYELIDKDNTTNEWTSINGVNGRKFTSKTDSSKYIFLSAGGEWDDEKSGYVGSEGYYWSTIRWDSSLKWLLFFGSSKLSMGGNRRWYGYSIRPVAPPRPW